MVHSFDEAKFAAMIGKELTTNSTVSEEAAKTVQEFYFRRIGLGVATLIITVLAVSLYVYVRRIERRQAGEGTKAGGTPLA
jgi:hypothetical protein